MVSVRRKPPGVRSVTVDMRTLLRLLLLWLPLAGAADPGDSLPDIGDRSQRVLDAQQEAAIGAEFYRQLRLGRRLLEDLPALRYLDSLGARLVSASDEPGGRFHFFLVRDTSINAFAIPGGYIGVHTGLFAAAEDESELAAVLAHEIAHVTQHHLARAYDQADRLSIPALAAVLAAVLVGTQNSEAGQAILMGTQAGAIQQQLNYTRSNESEADHIGMQILLRAGFDPRGMPRFFDRLQRQARLYGAGPPPLLRTHPVTTERIADALARLPAGSGPARSRHHDDLGFHLVKARLEALYASPDRARPERFDAKGTARDEDVTRRYALALALGREKRYRRAIEILEALHEKYPARSLFAYDLARLQRESGDLRSAQTRLQESLRLLPGDTLLLLERARLALDADQPDMAVRQLRTLLETSGKRLGFEIRQALLETLARAWRAAGDPARAHETLARRAEEAGDLAAAIAQLEQALALTRDDTLRSRLQARLHRLRLRQRASGSRH